jgi:hypothetical protein
MRLTIITVIGPLLPMRTRYLYRPTVTSLSGVYTHLSGVYTQLLHFVFADPLLSNVDVGFAP